MGIVDNLSRIGRDLDQAAAAIVEFDACERLRGWNEEAAWACYRAAELLHIAGQNVEAIERCARGLTHHAGVAELAWLAGLIEHRQGHYAQAIAWAHMAIANGVPAGNSVARTGFCNPVGLHEGPFDVLRFALRALGDNEGADRAEGYYNEALQKRLSARRIPNTPQKMSTSPMRSALEAPLK
jgi:tetratricopeptide (TPR) repeat protein